MLSQPIVRIALRVAAVETVGVDSIKFVSNLLQREWQRDKEHGAKQAAEKCVETQAHPAEFRPQHVIAQVINVGYHELRDGVTIL
jgi:hypothetical protein